MNDIPYNNWHLLSDSAIEREVGRYIKTERQRQNKTQSELAKQANMSRSTLSLLERGESVNLTTLIKALRVLGQLQILSNFEVKEKISPLALAKEDKAQMKRVRKYNTKTPTPKTDW